jgi:RNA polymerase sigma-70 factor (ECF subfamily)
MTLTSHFAPPGASGGARLAGPGGAPEAPLLALIAQGEHAAAIDLLVKTQGDAVYSFCLHIVKDATHAEDVRQKVFLQAYEGLSSFAGASSLGTWLLGIAKHRALDAARARRREAGRLFLDDGPLADAPDAAAGPSEAVERARAQSALRGCLERCVSADDQRLIQWHYQEGCSYEEIGARLGRKPDTLRARVARALVRLRRSLEEQGVTS